MRPDLDRLLNVTAYRAFDIDPERRILAGSDESGTTQLVEISRDGRMTALTALPGACTGRYVPGERTVIVSHDDGGNEQHQLSLLPLPVAGGGAPPPGRPTWFRWSAIPATCMCSPTSGRAGSATSPTGGTASPSTRSSGT